MSQIKIKEIITSYPTILGLGEDSFIYYWSTTDAQWKLFDDTYFIKNAPQNSNEQISFTIKALEEECEKDVERWFPKPAWPAWKGYFCNLFNEIKNILNKDFDQGIECKCNPMRGECCDPELYKQNIPKPCISPACILRKYQL